MLNRLRLASSAIIGSSKRAKTNHLLRFSSSSVAEASEKIKLHWLDLRASGLSMMERLSLEEALLRHDPERSWILVGTHDPWPHKYLDETTVPLPSYISSGSRPSRDCLVVMGIGGKPDQLLNIPKVKEDQVLVCKRFSGGGTVVLDSSSLWTTVIGRNHDFTHVQAYPKEIMEWSAQEVFGPTFDHLTETALKKPEDGKMTLVLDSKSGASTESKVYHMPKSASTQEVVADIPKFALRENDYVFGDLKMGGNAQSIIKGGWLHHTSFLWDYDPDNMEYLKLPAKRPDYRGDRPHDEFLVKLKPYFGNKNLFFKSLLHACQQSFDVNKVTLPEAMEVIDGNLGGMGQWWETNRTRIVDF
jgi:lipoate-protein ligase A